MLLRQLEYFVAVAKFRNFHKAAEHCCIEQSTLSIQIKKLEEELNFELIDRKSKPPDLTKSGRKVLKKAEKVIELVSKIKEMGQKR